MLTPVVSQRSHFEEWMVSEFTDKYRDGNKLVAVACAQKFVARGICVAPASSMQEMHLHQNMIAPYRPFGVDTDSGG